MAAPQTTLTFVGLCRRKDMIEHRVHLLVILQGGARFTGGDCAVMTFL